MTDKTQMWSEPGSGSTIYMRPVLGGGGGFMVKLQTSKLVGRDYLRDVYCSDLIVAVQRVKWIMANLVQGDWSLVP